MYGHRCLPYVYPYPYRRLPYTRAFTAALPYPYRRLPRRRAFTAALRLAAFLALRALASVLTLPPPSLHTCIHRRLTLTAAVPRTTCICRGLTLTAACPAAVHSPRPYPYRRLRPAAFPAHVHSPRPYVTAAFPAPRAFARGLTPTAAFPPSRALTYASRRIWPFEFLQRSKGMNLVGTVTQLEILLHEGVDQAAKCREIDDKFRGGPVETDTRPKGVFQAKSLGDLTQLIGMSHYLGYACVGLVLALVATTTVMSVQDRVKEHAVLQTIGFSGPQVFRLVLAESVVLSIAGGCLGVGIAMLMLKLSSLSVGAQAVTIAFTPSIRLAFTGLIVAAIAGGLAGIAPAMHAARTEIVPGLRNV